MTVIDESSRVDQQQQSQRFLQRICCCCVYDSKEPPVQLIRSGSLTYQQGKNNGGEVSAAKETIDDDDIRLEFHETSPRIIEEGNERNSINMNDIFLDGILKDSNTEHDRTEAVEEENVSICTDVVEEVDESELRDHSKPAQLKGRSGIVEDFESVSIHSQNDEGEETRKMSVIEFIQSESQIVRLTSDSRQDEGVRRNNERLTQSTHSEISDSEEEISIDKLSMNKGVSSNTTARIERNDEDYSMEMEDPQSRSDDGSDSEEGLSTVPIPRDDSPPPLPSIPPPRLSSSKLEHSPIPPPRSPKISKMYENADSSDEEIPISSHGLSKMQPVHFAPSPNPRTVIQDSQEITSIDSYNSSEDIPSYSGTSEKENSNRVTRISLKSDGRAEIHSPHSAVKISLETDRQELTDDEFSEKLI